MIPYQKPVYGNVVIENLNQLKLLVACTTALLACQRDNNLATDHDFARRYKFVKQLLAAGYMHHKTVTYYPNSTQTARHKIHMANYFNKIALTAAASLLATGIASQSALASESATYEITVTNLTNNVMFTPILGVAHSTAISLFEVGHSASVPLEELAEGGSPAALVELLAGVANADTAVGTPDRTPPLTEAGETVSFEITAPAHVRRFSMAAMLLPTNDSFVGLDTVTLPRRGSMTYYAAGYDSGTELNDQVCANIPGPRCGGEGFNPARDDRGDFVHISSGMHDIGDLSAATYDWRNPVASVTITRVR